MSNLRSQIVLTLLLTMLAAWLAVFALRYIENMRAETGMRDVVLQNGAKQALLSIPTSLLQTSTPGNDGFRLSHSDAFSGQTASVQVWALSDKRLLLRSPWSPEEPLVAAFKDGFYDIEVRGERMRVYALSDADGLIQVQLAKSATQLWNESTYRLWRGLAVLTLLFAGLTIVTWLVMRRAFRSVDKAHVAILSRTDVDLAPISTAGMPGEIRPFVVSINLLLARLAESRSRERRFLADAAHELRTPIAAMSAYAELAANGDNALARQQALEKLRGVASRISRLVEQLLDHARVETLNDRPTEAIALDRLVEMIVRDSEALAARKGQRIFLDAQAAMVTGDLDALGVLVQNLLDNALRYTQAGGRIAVACKTLPDQRVQFSIADNGPGIAVSERTRVFDRFYRAPGTTENGSGIGLSLVAHIAAVHHAQIHWSPGLDDAGVGLTITFRAAS